MDSAAVSVSHSSAVFHITKTAEIRLYSSEHVVADTDLVKGLHTDWPLCTDADKSDVPAFHKLGLKLHVSKYIRG